MINSYNLGKQIIDCQKLINYRRVWVFVLRSLWHYRETKALEIFFESDPLYKQIINKYPDIFLQLTRQVLYKNSTTAERCRNIIYHFSVLKTQLTNQAIQKIYLENGIQLWHEQLKEQSLSANLFFSTSEIRDGMMTLIFRCNDSRVYHVNFWLAFNKENNLSLYIGALQGSRGALPIYKDLTKMFFGYRPKNIILYTLQLFAQCLSVNEIKAVSNYGFQANNHFFRWNRKLKTSLDSFWIESGGTLTEDKRFYSLPVQEKRKSMEEIASHKRNLYRKRFAILDKIASGIVTTLTPLMSNVPEVQIKDAENSSMSK